MTTKKTNRIYEESVCATRKSYPEKEDMKEDLAPHEAFSRWNQLVRQERERQAARKAKDQADKSGGRKK